MKPSSILLYICFITTCCNSCRTIHGIETDSKPISHAIWDNLLKKNVNSSGLVNYESFIADSAELNEYIALIQNNYPNETTWTKNEILAYWINAYNAFTIQLVIRNYPLSSIKDIKQGVAFINSVWDIKFITIQNQQMDLNNIEHNILRKMNEPRIHFAVNCASLSCPKLRNEAYTAAKLNAQLTDQAIQFINDPSKNIIHANEAELSSIFNWFTGDFTKNGSIKDFINQYANIKMTDATKIDYMVYNWSLNKQ